MEGKSCDIKVPEVKEKKIKRQIVKMLGKTPSKKYFS